MLKIDPDSVRVPPVVGSNKILALVSWLSVLTQVILTAEIVVTLTVNETSRT